MTLARDAIRRVLRELRPDPWVEQVLQVTPDAWQRQLLRSNPGAQIICLTARQAGKTESASWLAAHTAIFRPGVRGLSVGGVIVADEAARLSPDLISALRPMRARHPEARFIMLSTAWSLADPFWLIWSGDDKSWLRIRATADANDRYSPKFLASELAALGKSAFDREYLGIPSGAGASPFSWELFDRVTATHTPR